MIVQMKDNRGRYSAFDVPPLDSINMAENYTYFLFTVLLDKFCHDIIYATYPRRTKKIFQNVKKV